MKEIMMAKYGEIALKGLNKNSFEQTLVENIRRKLKSMGRFSYSRAQSTIYITPLDDDIFMEDAVEQLKKVFGLGSVCKALIVEKNWSDITIQAVNYLKDILPRYSTFKVVAKRADKRFPMKSPEICASLGEIILNEFPHLTVDVNTPQVTITVDIREDNAFVCAEKFAGAGGIPVGSSGGALLLISGGIDSPVAGYMMAKRGVRVSAIHFVSPPYTSDRARIKVEKLCEKISDYCGDISFYCVPFTAIQENIKEHCAEELFTIIMRRIMMEIAEKIAVKNNLHALVTGESIGQVASQTMMAIACTDAVCKQIPVFRPVIGMDKIEIVDIARRIGTFETSIQPYEDCCTVFTPKHPKTKPKLFEVEIEQNKFDFAPLIQKAIEDCEINTIGG